VNQEAAMNLLWLLSTEKETETYRMWCIDYVRWLYGEGHFSLTKPFTDCFDLANLPKYVTFDCAVLEWFAVNYSLGFPQLEIINYLLGCGATPCRNFGWLLAFAKSWSIEETALIQKRFLDAGATLEWIYPGTHNDQLIPQWHASRLHCRFLCCFILSRLRHALGKDVAQQMARELWARRFDVELISPQVQEVQYREQDK
jgi:hypothetical protein